jgi:light-regulated signal transduction histidine kinase (bacteriophytochrome)
VNCFITIQMTSSLDSIYKKMASSLDGNLPQTRESSPGFDPAKHVSPVIAHELNNILAIVQGYAERLLMRYPDDAGLQPSLKLISESARRAATIIRDATPPNAKAPVRETVPPQPEPSVVV